MAGGRKRTTASMGSAIGMGETHTSHRQTRRARRPILCFSALREEVVQLYYNRDRDGLPRGWIARMKRAIRTLGGRLRCRSHGDGLRPQLVHSRGEQCQQGRWTAVDKTRRHEDREERAGILWNNRAVRRERLVIRGLTFYWRTHLAVVLGVATSVAVLAGALLVGTSVRASLRDLLLAQIGRTDEVVASQHFFTEALGSSIEGDRTFATSFQHLAPLIAAARGIVTSQESQRRAGDVTVYGVDDRFWRFHGVAVTGPGARAAHVSQALASQLHVSANARLVVRLQRITDVPIESLHGRKEDVGRSLRVTVASVLTRDTLGDFFPRAIPERGARRVPASRLVAGRAGCGRTSHTVSRRTSLVPRW